MNPYKQIFKELDLVVVASLGESVTRPDFSGDSFGCHALGTEVDSRNLFRLIVHVGVNVSDSYASFADVPQATIDKYNAVEPALLAGWEE